MSVDGENVQQDNTGLGSLSRFPGEIRNMIYRDVLLNSDAVVVTKTDIHKRTELLRTSSATRQEASRIFLEENMFIAPAGGPTKCVSSLIDMLSNIRKPASASRLKRRARLSGLSTIDEASIIDVLKKICKVGIAQVCVGSIFLATILAIHKPTRNDNEATQKAASTATDESDLKPESPNYRGVAFLYHYIGKECSLIAAKLRG